MNNNELSEIPAFQCFACTSGQVLNSPDLQGHYVVLYFYPKDDTPGCTREAQDFRDLYKEFTMRGAVVLGVSRDGLNRHASFKGKYNLPFELLSDAEEKLCELFDVIKMKNMYGKQIRGIERSTFLFDPEGKLVKAWRKVKVPGHAQAVLDTLRQLTDHSS